MVQLNVKKKKLRKPIFRKKIVFQVPESLTTKESRMKEKVEEQGCECIIYNADKQGLEVYETQKQELSAQVSQKSPYPQNGNQKSILPTHSDAIVYYKFPGP